MASKAALVAIYFILALFRLFQLASLAIKTSFPLIARPIRSILRLIFYKIIVKAYKAYYYIAKKTGLREKKITLLSLINQKLVHATIICLTLLITYANVTYDTKAESIAKSSEKTILETLIDSEFGDEEEQELVEEFFDQESLISPTQQSYLENLSLKSQPSASTDPDKEATEEGETAINPEGEALVKQDVIETRKTEVPRTEIVYHEVAQGETISTIARSYGVSVNTLLWENELSPYSIIRPGDKLAILPSSGVSCKVGKNETLGSIANRYGVDTQTIANANKIALNSPLQIGQKLIIPGGRRIEYARTQSRSYSGLSVLENLVTRRSANKPKSSPLIAGNKMAWPTSGYRITQYYSWRHNAIDVANKVGTPIYAADAGTVEYIGWGTGYGNQIVVNHGGGKKTRYAHLSKFYCQKGQEIGKGEAIGAMGSTGWSTGSHLHFEVIIGGAKYNPLNYVK